MRCAMLLSLITLLLVVPSPDPPALSRSKLSLHLIMRYTDGAKKVVAAGPPVLKILDLHDDMRAALRDYKRRHPDGKTVLRIYTRVRYERKDDPAASARDFWERVLKPPLERLPAPERRLIDYLEGPNEGDSTPCWGSVEDARWFSRFWETLAPIIRENGFRPCIGSIPVGNPPGSPQEMQAQLEAFVPALRAAKRADGAWSYHAYTVEYSADPGVERWYSLRYRQFYDYLRRRHPDLASLPMILTEGGVDRDGNPKTAGFAARGDAKRYQQWLAWFDRELQRDPYVLGVTLFQSGDTEVWTSFEHEPVTDWLAQHLTEQR